ncbi:MAG: flavodoxin [Oscillospiraceae bacterium]|nr:flavodoxin [Oscillospiraceae bacterium]
MSKLVVYFSYSGATKRKAEKLAKEVGADTFEIKPKVPYTVADVNWQDSSSRNVKEHEDPSCRPEIAEMPNLSGVEEIWIGYPIWWYTHPRIIETFFDQADLKGKTVHLFATSGVTGIEDSVSELKTAYPDVNIADGKRL